MKKEARKKTGLPLEKIGAFFITPCPAKVTDTKCPISTKTSYVDGAIAISEIFPALVEKMEKAETVEPLMQCGVIGVGWASSGGEAAALLKPNSVHLMVTDAPYGVQKGTAGRQDSIGGTIAAALPGWHSVLKPGGVLAISFNTHVTRRDALIRLMEKAGFEAVQTANLEHWVEQAISRDVILARKP